MKYIIIVLALALAGLSFQLYKVQMRLSSSQYQIAEIEKQSALALANAERDAREKESVLRNKLDELKKDLDEKSVIYSDQRNALLKRLRRAEANAATNLLVSQTNTDTRLRETSSRDIGVEIPGSIGEKDVQEALRADIIRENLIACYKQYDQIQQLILGK